MEATSELEGSGETKTMTTTRQLPTEYTKAWCPQCGVKTKLYFLFTLKDGVYKEATGNVECSDCFKDSTIAEVSDLYKINSFHQQGLLTQ